ncbi:MAG: putative rane spanning protein [Chloroflexi bacterium]|nr:putative rane spanning protein [Chloroflexota bacterium]
MPKLAPYALTLLRVIVGITFIVHGYAKTGFVGGFADGLAAMNLPLPNIAAIVIIAVEIIGGGALILGIGTRWLGLVLAAEMAFIAMFVKMPTVGFMAGRGVGAELDLNLFAALLVIATVGSGALSVEGTLLGRKKARD